MRVIILSVMLLKLGSWASASEPLTVELHPVDSEKDSHFGFKPSFSATSKSQGLPAGRTIPGLDASQAAYFNLPLNGAQEKVTLIWREADQSGACWLLIEKGEDLRVEALKLQPDEPMGLPGMSLEKTLRLETPKGEPISLNTKISVLADRPYVYFQSLDARKGTVELDGRQITVGLLRTPTSAAFSIGPGTRILLDLDEDGKFGSSTKLGEDGELRFSEGFPLNQPFLVNGKPYRASNVFPDGSQLQIEPASLQPAVARGFEMPELEVELLEGGRLSLSQLRGKTIVLNWWFTTCSPCLTEMPGLNEMAQRYSGRSDVEFVAIANNDRETLEAFLKETPFRFRQALADEQTVNLMGQGFPRHLIIDKAGRIALDRRGGSKTVHELLEAVLEKVLAGR